MKWKLKILLLLTFGLLVVSHNNCGITPNPFRGIDSVLGPKGTETGNPMTILAALPEVILSAEYPTLPPDRRILTVGAIGRQFKDCQSAIDQAQPGDEIVIDAGYVCSSIRLRAKGNSDQFIVIRTSALNELRPHGQRIKKSDAPKLAVIETSNEYAAIRTDLYAHHYYFVGLEVRMAPNSKHDIYTLVDLGNNDLTDISQIPHNIVIARSWIHAGPDQEVKRGVKLNSAETSIVDSIIDDIHDDEGFAMAIHGWTLGKGPFKIVNNELSSSGYTFLLGGSPTPINELIPSDVEFKNNLVHKNLDWKKPVNTLNGYNGLWPMRALLALNNAQRVLIEGNIFEERWVSSDDQGYAIAFFPRSSGGRGAGAGQSWVRVQDITFKNNVVRNSAGFAHLRLQDPIQPLAIIQRVDFTNNFIYNIGGGYTGDATGLIKVEFSSPGPIRFTHNTMLLSNDSNQSIISLDEDANIEQFIFTDNILSGSSGIKKDKQSEGTSSLSSSFNNLAFNRNVFARVLSNIYKPFDTHNSFVTTTNEIGFIQDPSLGVPNIQSLNLSSTSPFINYCEHGSSVGADTLGK